MANATAMTAPLTARRRRRRAPALALALLLGGVAACSSAPLPADELAATALPEGTVVDPTTGEVVDATTGQVVDPVTGAPVAVDPVTGAPVQQPSSGGGAPAAPAAGGAPAAPGAPAAGGGPAAPAPPRTQLWSGKDDTIGITPTSITMCAHAALTYGAAFQTEAADFNVFWTALNTEKGGVFGRKVDVTYENDDYKPDTAVVAARACKAKNPFLLLGGIGFDQIPAVRNYAETERIPYLHHTATVNGSAGLKYSFTSLPTVERMGEAFGQLYLSKYAGKKLGIIKRDGDNWEPGVKAFKAFVGDRGTIVAERGVPQNKGNYTEEIVAMRNAGAEVVWLWENALISTQVVAQFKAQEYAPNMMLFPFNLTAQTLDDDALTPPLDGVAMFSAYSRGDYGGSFSAYADDVKLFEQQYAKYRPNVDLGGVGGDLLFLNWQAQKSLADILQACGKDCTRNRFVDTLTSYKKVPTSSACLIDFTRDGKRGSDKVNFMTTYRSPSGKVNWRNTSACVGRG